MKKKSKKAIEPEKLHKYTIVIQNFDGRSKRMGLKSTLQITKPVTEARAREHLEAAIKKLAGPSYCYEVLRDGWFGVKL